jgi:outer membrane protein assembly factor BamB
LRWSDAESEHCDEDGRPGGPKVIPNLVTTMPGGLLVRHSGSDGESIVALDAADGAVLWRRPVAARTEVAAGDGVIVLARSTCEEGD